jgi:4-aminobutyrate aminotransferase-like enzyme
MVRPEFKRLPLVVESTQGNYIISGGKKYLDISGSAMTVGYDFLKRLPSPVSLLVYDNIYTMELTEKLKKISGVENVAYATSGTEACDAALSRWEVPIISLEGGYHGLSYLTYRVSNGTGIDLKNSIVHLKVDKRRDQIRDPIEYNEELLKKAKKNLNLEEAVIIFEPIQSDGGMLIISDEFLNYLKEKVSEFNMRIIIDEVYTGFGRSGYILYFKKLNIKPDMVCLGKGMAAGLPSGAILYNGDWDLPYHGAISMQGGNMTNSFASLKVMDFLTEEKLRKVREGGEMIIREIKKINSPYVYEVRGSGYMVGIEIGNDKTFDYEKANEIRKKLYENNIIITLVGNRNNTVKITPPLTITQKELHTLLEKLKVAIL